MTLASGQIIHNRYRIARLVGQGGFGAVYRAWDMALEQPVALKENTGNGGDTQRQFEREAKLLAGLRHSNLPRVIDHFIIPGQGQYLVMDFVEGKSLGALLRERNLPFEEADAVKWVGQVSEALTYLHTRTPPIIHRDIKPDNIILTNDGRAMLVDFGISKIFDESKGTTTGAQAVTHGYSPLEQYGRGKTDARSDIYSLGATLYTLLTGLVPPDAPDLVNGLETLRPPRQANPALRESTSAAIMAAMAPSISQRISSAAGFEQLLAVKSPPAARGTVIAPMTRDATYLAPMTTPPASIPSPASGAPPRDTNTGKAKRSVPVWGWVVALVALVALSAWAGISLTGRDSSSGETPEPPTTESVAAGETPATATAPFTATPSPTAVSTTRPPPTVTPTSRSGTGPVPVSDTPSPTATPTATPMPAPRAGDIRIVERGSLVVEQVFVPAGSFVMGSESGETNERPAHEVALDAFWIDRMEVTNEQFFQCTQDGSCRPPSTVSSFSRPDYYGNSQYLNFPVLNVAWQDAQDYCEWASGRLPSEAEWEYAARGPQSLIYPWGNEPATCDLVNYGTECVGDTSEAGSYPRGASWVGALDLAGNVWEWVNDWYSGDYYARSQDRNPPGPESGESKVLRGGGWDRVGLTQRSAFRLDYQPDFRYYAIGFRCIQE